MQIIRILLLDCVIVGVAILLIAVSIRFLDFILDERSRELHWEGHRRTDLIRFNQFTENGVWPWKGGVMEGKTTEKFRDIYPIPSSDIIANPTLKQNDGY